VLLILSLPRRRVLGRWRVSYLCFRTYSARNQDCRATVAAKKRKEGVKCQTITFELNEFSLFGNSPSPPSPHHSYKSKLRTRPTPCAHTHTHTHAQTCRPTRPPRFVMRYYANGIFIIPDTRGKKIFGHYGFLLRHDRSPSLLVP